MDFLKSIAPWLAAAATGNVPALVGMAANELTSVLGYDVEPEKTAIEKAVSGATQEQLIKLKELDQAFQTKMQELGFTHIQALEQLAVDNQKSARNSMVESGLSLHLFWMSVLLLGMTIGTNVWMLTYGIPESMSEVALGRAIGFLENISMIILGFWYGTSHGSMMKNGVIGVK
jgi:hypothetical protein